MSPGYLWNSFLTSSSLFLHLSFFEARLRLRYCSTSSGFAAPPSTAHSKSRRYAQDDVETKDDDGIGPLSVLALLAKFPNAILYPRLKLT